MSTLSREVTDAALLVAACAIVAVILLALSVGGTFTPDEGHYLATVVALRHGTFRLPSTAGLMASREFLSFGAVDYFATVSSTPVAGVQPPLHAFLALPLSYFGFGALALLNVAGFVGTGALVFLLARQHATRRSTPWIALALYWLGGYTLEYAIGVWPHALAVGLCTAGLFAAFRATDRPSMAYAGLSGLLLGVAMGVRYQEVLYFALVGVGIALTTLLPSAVANAGSALARAKRAALLGGSYAAGAAPPLLLSAWVNQQRLGIFHPLTKGRGYTTVSSMLPSEGHTQSLQWLRALAMKLFDASLMPAAVSADSTQERFGSGLASHAVLFGGVVKKALVQSSPWAMLAMIAFFLAWHGRTEREQKARRLGVVFFGTVGAFAVAGLARGEGYCFNTRYLLEILPAAAIAAAWSLDDRPGARWPALALAFLLGAAPAAFSLFLPATSLLRHEIVLRAPQFVALVILVFYIIRRARPLLPHACAAGLGWAFAIHGGDDLRASLATRYEHAFYADVVGSHLPKERSALFAYWGAAVPFAALTLEHELLVVDPILDQGRTLRELSEQLLARGDHLFVLPYRMPPALLRTILDGRAVRRLEEPRIVILEVQRRPLGGVQ